MAIEAALAEELTRLQNSNYRFLALLGYDGELDLALLNVKNRIRRISLLEDVLIRHPKLRIYVMHFGSPFVDDMIALLYSYPQVYVDVAQNDWGFPRKHFHSQLRRLVDAGFGKRIVFGSDQMIWPDTIALAIETIESADFLTVEQKRDIFYNNAARFLRLDEKDRARVF